MSLFCCSLASCFVFVGKPRENYLSIYGSLCQVLMKNLACKTIHQLQNSSIWGQQVKYLSNFPKQVLHHVLVIYIFSYLWSVFWKYLWSTKPHFLNAHSKCSATTQGWPVESLTTLVKGLGCLLLLSSIQKALMSNFSYM
jgi:hypothetical protein